MPDGERGLSLVASGGGSGAEGEPAAPGGTSTSPATTTAGRRPSSTPWCSASAPSTAFPGEDILVGLSSSVDRQWSHARLVRDRGGLTPVDLPADETAYVQLLYMDDDLA